MSRGEEKEMSSPLKIGADTQRKEHQAQSDGMSNVFLVLSECISIKEKFLHTLIVESAFILRKKLYRYYWSVK